MLHFARSDDPVCSVQRALSLVCTISIVCWMHTTAVIRLSSSLQENGLYSWLNKRLILTGITSLQTIQTSCNIKQPSTLVGVARFGEIMCRNDWSRRPRKVHSGKSDFRSAGGNYGTLSFARLCVSRMSWRETSPSSWDMQMPRFTSATILTVLRIFLFVFSHLPVQVATRHIVPIKSLILSASVLGVAER